MSVTAIAPCGVEERGVGGIGLGVASDADLVGSVRRGEDRAFEELYQRYHRRIAAYVYGMVNDYGRAEDITQDVFISALRRMRETERPIAFKPWVYEIAKNACIDQFRRSKRAEEVSYDAEDGLGASDYGRLVTTGPSPDAAVDAKQQLAHLCGAFGGLSETHHEILVLRELEGLSYREIGERMGLSRPSVESTLFRARRRLTEEYDELVSGQRCLRIQSIITTATTGMLGTRDSRRVARHIAHCQPCRRQAVTAGLDTATLAPRRPLRERVAAKVAALLPFPFLRRGRGDELASMPATTQIAGQVAMYAEPLAAGWTKAAAVGATLVLAGGVAGVGSKLSSQPVSSIHEGRSGGQLAAPSSAPASRSERRGPVLRRSSGTRPAGTGTAAARKRDSAGTTGAGTSVTPTTPDNPALAPNYDGGSTSGPASGLLPGTGGGAGNGSQPPADDPASANAPIKATSLSAVQDMAQSVDPTAGATVGEVRELIEDATGLGG
jgi:RNA polymerase sigma factor (sigma-70 family)